MEILIVGGGVAGLSAGVHAQLAGHHATVLERHAVPGGNLTGWDRGGCHIDNCIHWLTGTNPVTERYRTWQTLGALGNVEILHPPTLYTYEQDGKTLSLHRDPERLRAQLLALSPADAREIGALLRAVRAAMRLGGIGGRGERPSTAAEKAAAAAVLARYLPLTTGQLAQRFREPAIRGFLSSFLTEDFGAIALLSVFATFCAGDGDLPRGGSCAMAARIAARFRALGGTLVCGAGVSALQTSGRRATAVRTENGYRLPADAVILAADPTAVFGPLLQKEQMPPALRRRYGHPRLHRFSSCHCAFSCQTAALPFRGDLIVPLPPDAQAALGGARLILREFSHEPDFAPPGRTVLQAMVFLPEAACRALLRRREDAAAYRAEKQRLARQTAALLRSRWPALGKTLQLLDVWTPASYRRYTGAALGSYMSFAFSSRFVPTLLPGRVPGLDNVLLATQWQTAPGGLPAAAAAGRAAIASLR